MHPLLGIPMASIFAAAVLATAIATREPDRGLSRLQSAILLCTGLWSLFDLLMGTAPEPEWAEHWLRASTASALPIGAMILHLMLRLLSEVGRFRGILAAAYAASGLGIALALLTPLSIAGVEPAAWGWILVPGPLHGPVYLVATLAPALTALAWVPALWLEPSAERRSAAAVQASGVLCFCAATGADALLPVLGVPCPRLGGASLVVWAVLTWWVVYRKRDPRQAPERFAREILETLPDAVALVRMDGRIRSTNERLAKLTGSRAEVLLGSPVADLLPSEAQEHEPGDRECELLTTAGERVPVSVSSSALSDPNHHTIGRVLVIRDLREVVSLRSRLASAGRLVAVGQLAAGIAHEINNPVAYVGANLRLLTRHWEALAEKLAKPRGPGARAVLDTGPELLAESSEGLERVAAIVRDVGGFTGGGPERQSADLAELLDTAARLASHQLSVARIERSYEARPRVPCVPQELLQVFLNLLVNAGQALGQGGRIRLATRVEGGEAVVEVRDDGEGIPAELLERVFEPFFTTKPVGEGTGLGLSISRQIVAQHGGSISVESTPGQGTCFRVRLPGEAEREEAKGDAP